MLTSLEKSGVEEALRERRFGDLRDAFRDRETADVAVTIDELDPDHRAVVFRLLGRDLAAEIFEHLSPESQEGLIKALAREEVGRILNDMSPDDRTQLLEELPASVTKQVLALLSPEERRITNQLLGYPEDSIGRLMTPDFISIQEDWTVRQSLDHIRRNGEDSETLNVINVVDGSGLLIDDLRVRQLLLADPDANVSEITDGQFIALKATDDQENAVQVFSEYDRAAFPVTDSRGVLLGIVTWDDAFDVAEEEATEDIQKIGGSEALDHPYLRVGFGELLRKRGVWLVLLFLGQLLTLNAMGWFEERLREAMVLMLFIPLIISSGGNSGSQAATLVVRGLAIDDLNPKDWWTVMRREIAFGVSIGVLLAGIGSLRIWAGNFDFPWLDLSLAVGLSLMCVVLWGVLIGSMLPFVMHSMGADPATTSTPFVATIVDVTGLILYFLIATAILGI